MIRRIVLALVCLAASCGAALALNDSSIPTRIPTFWGTSAPGGNITCPIPIPSQIGITSGRASWTDGFPPVTFNPVGSGGVPPAGADFNGVLCQLSQWTRWQNAGGPIFYDSGFSAAIGGYPNGAVLAQAASQNCVWVSTVDNNTSDPDIGGANWAGSCPGGGVGGTSTGPANAQVVTTTPFTLAVLSRVCFVAGNANTSALQINVNSAGLVNVFQRTEGGLIALVGGEVQTGMVTCVEWDGTQWELDTFATNASLVNQGQILTGGANSKSFSNGSPAASATLTVDCSKGPYQTLTGNAAFTIAPPSIALPADSAGCDILLTNGASAGTISFSGTFTVSGNTGDPLTTVNGNKFIIHVEVIAGISTYFIKSLQ